MRVKSAAALVAGAAAMPRLIALLAERGDVTGEFLEKSDVFAQTFVDSGTFGFIPEHPSAYTQPLYGFFLTPIYWLAGQHWLAIGAAQTAVAVLTALLVLAVGRKVTTEPVAVLAALITTLHPY